MIHISLMGSTEVFLSGIIEPKMAFECMIPDVALAGIYISDLYSASVMKEGVVSMETKE